MTLNLEVNQKDEQNAALGSGDLLLTCDSPHLGRREGYDAIRMSLHVSDAGAIATDTFGLGPCSSWRQRLDEIAKMVQWCAWHASLVCG